MLVLMLMLRSSFVMKVMVLDIAMSFVRPGDGRSGRPQTSSGSWVATPQDRAQVLQRCARYVTMGPVNWENLARSRRQPQGSPRQKLLQSCEVASLLNNCCATSAARHPSCEVLAPSRRPDVDACAIAVDASCWCHAIDLSLPLTSVARPCGGRPCGSATSSSPSGTNPPSRERG